jgi:hypothetical protein
MFPGFEVGFLGTPLIPSSFLFVFSWTNSAISFTIVISNYSSVVAGSVKDLHRKGELQCTRKTVP